MNETGTVASYEFPFFGAVMRQTGHREEEVTYIVQETSYPVENSDRVVWRRRFATRAVTAGVARDR